MDGNAIPGSPPFEWQALFDVTSASITTVPPYISNPGNQTLAAAGHSAALAWIWNEALEEWH